MKVTQQGHDLKIEFDDKGGSSGIKAFLIIQIAAFASFSGLGIAGFISIISREKYIPALICLCGTVFFSIATWRLIKRLTTREYLLLTDQAILVVQSSSGHKRVNEYFFDGITNLCYVGITDPIPSKNLNAWAYSQRVNMYSDKGDIAFFYESREIRFGVGVTTWDVEELSRLLSEKTAGTLTITGLPEEIPEEMWQA